MRRRLSLAAKPLPRPSAPAAALRGVGARGPARAHRLARAILASPFRPSRERLVHGVAHRLARAQAAEARCGRHKDHAQFLLGIDPEVGAVDPGPIIITGAPGHRRNPVLAAYREAQTETVARGSRIHAVGDAIVEGGR